MAERICILGVACGAAFLVAACKHDDVQTRPLSIATPMTLDPDVLGASDLAILVPLRGLARAAPSDPLGGSGDGVCNAPTLDLAPQGALPPAPGAVVGAAPTLGRPLFEQLAQEAFASLPRIDVPKDLEPGLRSRILAFNAQTVGKRRVCGESSDMPSMSEAELLETRTNVALVHGTNTDICDYSRWRIVGFRFEPCLERPDIDGWDDAGVLPECPTREVRIVAQPIHRDANGAWIVSDDALHLLYSLDDVAGLVKDLRALRQLSVDQLSQKPWKAEDDRNLFLLRPHAGLRAEMGRCDGPVAAAFRGLLGRWAPQSRLKAVTFMSGSLDGAHWSMAERKIVDGQPDTTPLRIESVSLPLEREGVSPLATDETRSPSVHTVYDEPLATLEYESLAQHARDLAAIADPRRVTREGPHATNCVSCHLVDRALTMVGEQLKQGPGFAGIDPYKRVDGSDVVAWPPFRQRRHQLTNFRNFGYGPGFQFGVSLRTINEVDAQVEAIARFFPKGAVDPIVTQ
jgi:hypothetical protein